jgi:hypothetical protein
VPSKREVRGEKLFRIVVFPDSLSQLRDRLDAEQDLCERQQNMALSEESGDFLASKSIFDKLRQ